MWGWLFEQPNTWQEIVIGVILAVAVLYLEDLIDQWRNRKEQS